MLSLETAQAPHKLRRVAIEPVTRVEGHGKVTILLDDENRVHQVRLHIVEFRGFEIFIRGRPFWEVPIAVQRLCGICPVSHLLAATKAMDLIAGYGPLTPTAEKLRRLLHYGQIVQSHALHFFHLSSPDLLLGFESEVAKRNIIRVAAAFPDPAKRVVLTSKFGQEVIRHIAGKRIHGTGVIPGGMNKPLSVADRDSMRSAIDEIVGWSREAVGLVIRLHETNPSFYKTFGESRANMMGLVDRRGALDFYHGALRARDADGGPIFDQVDYATYQSVLQEDIKTWSYMKFPHIRTLGAESGWYRVGPLARVQICDVMPTPLAEAERRTLLGVDGGKPLHGALMYHWARTSSHPARATRSSRSGPKPSRARSAIGSPRSRAHDRDAARRRNGARVARRSRYRRDRPHGRQGSEAGRGGRGDRGAARHALPSLSRGR
jgi:NAD-reducing hydrogenase large subunit